MSRLSRASFGVFMGERKPEPLVVMQDPDTPQQNPDTPQDKRIDFTKDENVERGNWTGKGDFLVACLGYAVGLGNVWRFPYLCYKNGGAVFFIPYICNLVFVGIPIFFLELSLGQFTSSSPLTCWNMAPVFSGVGVGMVMISGMVGIYYNMIIAWALWYFFASLAHAKDLPWQYCDNSWNTKFCSLNFAVGINKTECENMGLLAQDDGICYNETVERPEYVGYMYAVWNQTKAIENNMKLRLPTEEYLYGRALYRDLSTGIDDLGETSYELVLALLTTWTLVFFSLINGVKSSGKVVYFTALFPYVILIILLGRGASLQGHIDGIKYYILEVDWDKLSHAQVWKDAAVQIFFSLSTSWGGLIALSSYNRFHNDVLRDSLIVSLGNCLTSFFAGFVIFSFLGFLAHSRQISIDNVAEKGAGLAFVIYPDAIASMPVSGLWAVLFFFMLITLGLDTEFALVETVTTSILDWKPEWRDRKGLVVFMTCFVMFLCGMPLCTWGGQYVVTLMDTFAGAWNVLIIGMLEAIILSWVYGFMSGPLKKPGPRLKLDILAMLGEDNMWHFDKFYYVWAVCWHLITPIILFALLIFTWVDYQPLTDGDYKFPEYAEGIGWFLTIIPIAAILAIAIYKIIRQIRAKEPIVDVIRPNKFWGPALVKHRKLVLEYAPDNFELDPWDEENKSGVFRKGSNSSRGSKGSNKGTKSPICGNLDSFNMDSLENPHEQNV